MIRRPPRSTLFPYHDALPICAGALVPRAGGGGEGADAPRHGRGDGAQAGLGLLDNVAEAAVGLVHEIPRESLRSPRRDRKSTRLNSSHANISYAVFCLKKKQK